MGITFLLFSANNAMLWKIYHECHWSEIAKLFHFMQLFLITDRNGHAVGELVSLEAHWSDLVSCKKCFGESHWPMFVNCELWIVNLWWLYAKHANKTRQPMCCSHRKRKGPYDIWQIDNHNQMVGVAFSSCHTLPQFPVDFPACLVTSTTGLTADWSYWGHVFFYS